MNLVGLVEALKAAFGGSRNVDPFSVSPREAVRDIPSYREGEDLAKYLRGLEAELSEFSMPILAGCVAVQTSFQGER